MIFAAMYMGDFSTYKEKAFIDSHAEIYHFQMDLRVKKYDRFLDAGYYHFDRDVVLEIQI